MCTLPARRQGFDLPYLASIFTAAGLRRYSWPLPVTFEERIRVDGVNIAWTNWPRSRCS
ncbi:MAG: hypothetical protein ACLTMP_03695 [Eggerthella lenta]